MSHHTPAENKCNKRTYADMEFSGEASNVADDYHQLRQRAEEAKRNKAQAVEERSKAIKEAKGKTQSQRQRMTKKDAIESQEGKEALRPISGEDEDAKVESQEGNCAEESRRPDGPPLPPQKLEGRKPDTYSNSEIDCHKWRGFSDEGSSKGSSDPQGATIGTCMSEDGAKKVGRKLEASEAESQNQPETKKPKGDKDSQGELKDTKMEAGLSPDQVGKAKGSTPHKAIRASPPSKKNPHDGTDGPARTSTGKRSSGQIYNDRQAFPDSRVSHGTREVILRMKTSKLEVFHFGGDSDAEEPHENPILQISPCTEPTPGEIARPFRAHK